VTAPRFVVYRMTGGYWEPEEPLRLRSFSCEDEAADFCAELGRRGTHAWVADETDETDEVDDA
jgi:hypothetical protein